MPSREQGSPGSDEVRCGILARCLGVFSSLIWWSLLVVLVLFALYAGIGRQLTANIDRFTDDLEVALSEASGLDITVGSLSSRWFWLDPAVTAKDIRIRSRDSDRLSAELEHLGVRLDFIASLFRMRLVFRNFDADGLELTLIRPPGDEHINPVEEMADLAGPATPKWQEWLRLAGHWLSNPEARVTRVSMALGPSREDLRFLDIPQLDLSYRSGLFQAAGRAMQSGTATQLASFALVGQRFFRGEFTGQLYLDVDSGRLFDGLIDDLSWKGIRVEGFDIGGNLWLTFDRGTLHQVQGEVRTPYLQLGVNQQSLAPLENIQARFGWRDGEALTLQGLQWQWLDSDISPFSIRLQPHPRGAALVADSLPLKPLRRLVRALRILPQEADKALADYLPSGYLDDLLLILPEQPADFSLTSRFRELGVRAASGAPGATGLNGWLQLDAHSGAVTLDTRTPSTLGFPELFNTRWNLNRLAGTVTWLIDGEVIRVVSNDLDIDYADNTRITGAFDLRLQTAGEDNLGLRVSVEGGSADMVADFVPAHVVDESLYQWLSTSIREAEVAGAYYGHGRIDSQAPPGSFVSSMWFDFEQGRVQYDPNWPLVEQASGRVEVQNTDTRVTLSGGRTAGLTITGASVTTIPDERGQGRITGLKVDASARVPGTAIPWWLENTPLSGLLGYDGLDAVYGGDFRLGLGLELPLDSGGQKTRVIANVKTENGEFELPGAGLAWTQISTDLTFDTREGFSGDGLAAEFFGQPVRVDFQMMGETGLAIRQQGRLAVPEFPASVGLSEALFTGLSGMLDYSAGIVLGAGEADPVITVTSDLAGLAVDWPGALAKEPEASAPLEVSIDPFAEGGIRVLADWQERLKAVYQWRETGFDLTFDEVRLGTQTLTGIEIEALNLDTAWVVHTRSERAAGRVSLPKSGGTIIADFEHLSLIREDQVSASGDTPHLLTLEEQLQAFRELDIGNWPDVDASIDDLRLGNESAGSWRFRLRPAPEKLNVRGLEGRLGSLVLAGDMAWSIVGDRETTRFTGTLEGGALKDLEALTGSVIPMTNAQTAVELDLSWPGSPDEIAPGKLSGTVSARLDDGVIMQESNSAQLFRIFNLLNTDTLWRRLRLDFSDLYERGVAFDAISGKANVTDGLVTMDPELQLVGPSGAFKLSGSTNMVNETLDMRLVLVLPITQNLPLAAILMGAGAPIGGALFVLDKILGDPLSRLTSATYTVSGTWAEPNVELRGVFDTGP
ncbi:hypothetical protein C7H09_11555 [Marinobacter fuscus]|uniref:YhdP central domain-containing protein n=1 Tax=Marinobacter fuscus TaxID=2109942 RepID=A0A2T1K8X5_9GAMM|nr:hypothetical protein C7H09_11555 [Marinobacter fuscus]